MNPDDKPPPYSEVSPPGQEYHPQMQGPPPPMMSPPPPGPIPLPGAPLGPPHGPPLGPPHGPPHGPPRGPPLAGDRMPLAGAPPAAGYGSVTYVTTTTVPAHEVIIVGGCPACRIGVLEDDFSCLGIFCAIFFFPLGILCCLATRQRRCPNCGAIFG